MFWRFMQPRFLTPAARACLSLRLLQKARKRVEADIA
jgi:hypothetical protein